MRSFPRFAPVALACLLIGIPLWTAILAPDMLSAAMFADPGFWIAAVAGLAPLLFGFWIGKRADLGSGARR